MSQKTKIEWTENTWNPVTGCTPISSGCSNCYAKRMALRLQKMGNPKYRNGFNITLHEHCLKEPLTWKSNSMIFVNSMSDLFHDDIPLDFIKKVFNVMNATPNHTYQILTKRADRLKAMSCHLNWTKNIWMGVSVENYRTKKRINCLRETGAHVKFISFEPLLNSVGQIDLSNIDWAIVGGESGPHSRLIREDWILNIKKQCEEQDCHFYFKQWGGTNKKKTGRELLGQTWDNMPKAKVLPNLNTKNL